MRFNPFSRSAAPQKKSSASGPLIAFHGAGRPVWTPRDYASLAREGYASNVIAFRSIRLIAESVATIPLQVHENGSMLTEHPLLTLLANPNPAQSGPELIETMIGHLQTAGNAYLEMVSPDGITPSEIYALRPDRMRVVPGQDGWPAAYDYTVGGKTHRYMVNEGISPILHLRSFHPLDDHYGMSPLEVAAIPVDIHQAAARWNKSLLDNAARPSGAIVYSGGDGQSHLTESQYRRLSDELVDNHQGAANAGRPMLLEGGLDWKPMGFSPADMEFMQTKQAAAREIALAFGVPPMMLGLPGDNTYSNYQEANRAFYRQTIMPLATKMTSALTRWLMDRYEDAPVIKPDFDEISALSPERDARWNRIANAGFLTDDEKRTLLGLPAHTEDQE